MPIELPAAPNEIVDMVAMRLRSLPPAGGSASGASDDFRIYRPLPLFSIGIDHLADFDGEGARAAKQLG